MNDSPQTWDLHGFFIRLGDSLKFRLSNILMLVAVIAIALGWFVDRRINSRQKVVGTWYYPTSDISLLGYTSTLELRSDGTFTKTQNYRTSYEKFDGTYQIDESGKYNFHVDEKIESSDLWDSIAETTSNDIYKPAAIELDATYLCRCAIDSAGFLVIDAQDWNFGEEDSGIRWETHARITKYYIKKRKN